MLKIDSILKDESDEGNCKKYLMVREEATWDVAFDICKLKKMQLLSIESSEEQKCIEHLEITG